MKPLDKDKLNECLEILDTTDLGLSMVWLWTWSTIKNFMRDDEWIVNVTEDQMWDNLCEAVKAGQGFSLEYGSEQHYEEVMEWMVNRDYIQDSSMKEDEDADD
jgi:hypothetical protein